MKQQPDISIVTINYNGLQETEQLIESLQQNPQKCSYEVIVVDNGSVQNEAKILQAKYPYIQSIRSERNLGFSGGNNLGICVAKGKCIFLLNNDTLVSDDSLVYLYETLMSSSDIGAVSPKIKFAFPPRNIQFAGFTPLSKYTLRNRAIGYNEPDKGQFDVPKATHFLHGAAMIVKREVIENIGLMPEIYFLYYEEMDWCTRMRNHGYQLRYEPRCTIYHKESCSTGKDSPLKTYYLTRNRLLYTWRNRHGRTLFISLIYQLLIADFKNIVVNLLHAKSAQARAIFEGCVDFFRLKHKRE
ncbi:glycosyltransferase family 2 protein [Butyricimonas hominis]|jgi:glycosyltransferase, group 2 family protein|uniref:Glycosyltransferase family 2 protein n=1 Tax=Butyricimonas hominis TaxID=2763032 RepID=A0ABR7D1Z7_9BACT|nr:glycosyltransferase family 2 protein [Butyricimonas hominis]MBC5621941.1 glycosyltransferase family 2 protein [Butyricimonas hominis]